MEVLLDARMAARGLGISTFIERLVRGLGAHDGVTTRLWGGSTGPGLSGGLGALAHSGLFDLSPRLDPRTGSFHAVHYASNLCSIFPGSNSVVTIHDLLYRQRGRKRDRVIAFLLESGMVRAGRVVASSERTRAEIERSFPEATGRITVIPAGLRRIPFPDQPRRHLLAFGAGADPRKRTDLIADVYEMYRKAVSDPLPLVVLGHAGLTETQRTRFAKLGAHVPDSATREEVDAFMAGAAALVFTSRAEGIGLPIIEAAEAGTPVVMDAGADVTAEVIGRHCVRVAAATPADWVDGIERAIAGGPVRDGLDLPDWPTTAARYLELYRQVAR